MLSLIQGLNFTDLTLNCSLGVASIYTKSSLAGKCSTLQL